MTDGGHFENGATQKKHEVDNDTAGNKLAYGLESPCIKVSFGNIFFTDVMPKCLIFPYY